MADEPKPEPADAKAGGNAEPPAPPPDSRLPAEPLSDGTTPTILATGETHHSVPKGKTSLTSIYRKADVTTTLITLGGAIVAAGLIVGVYAYLTRTKAPTTTTPKVTTLSQADLNKLGAFFSGNSAGGSAEILTISSSSFFKNQVALGSDLKVTGGISDDGLTALSDLTVEKTSTLGITNVRGQLTVNGPLTVQSPALFNGGASFKGNLSTTGNGSFGGSLSAAGITVQSLSVSGTLNVNGHLSVGGLQPGASAPSGGSVTVQGNDSAGTVTVTLPASPIPGTALITVNFHAGFSAVPIINITPAGRSSAEIEPYVSATANGFTISAAAGSSSKSFAFNYWVVQY